MTGIGRFGLDRLGLLPPSSEERFPRMFGPVKFHRNGRFFASRAREQGSPRPQRGHHVHRRIYPLGHPATHFENHPPQYPEPSPTRPSRLGSPIPRRGGLRTPAKGASRSPTRITVRPPAHRHRTGWERNASAFVWPYRPGAETAPLVCIILSLLGDSVLGAGRGVPDADASLGR